MDSEKPTPANPLGISLSELDSRTRTIGLLLLVVNAVFGVSTLAGAGLRLLSQPEVIVAFTVLGVVLIGSLVAIVIIEKAAMEGGTTLRPSGKTPSNEILDGLINGALEMVCRATSLPASPQDASVRAFVFRAEGSQLVCRYYWAQNPTREMVGTTRFDMLPDVALEVAVVDCALSRKIRRKPVAPPSTRVEQTAQGTIQRNLTYVLAAPIISQKGDLLGVVDFDTSSHTGEDRLSTEIADAAVFQMSQLLQGILALSQPPLTTAV